MTRLERHRDGRSSAAILPQDKKATPRYCIGGVVPGRSLAGRSGSFLGWSCNGVCLGGWIALGSARDNRRSRNSVDIDGRSDGSIAYRLAGRKKAYRPISTQPFSSI